MNKLINWFKNQNKWSLLRWLALVALVLSAPIALGWVVLVSIIITLQNHWEKRMDDSRTRICSTVATLAMIGCSMSTLWCSLPGFVIVTTVLIATLCFDPIIPDRYAVEDRHYGMPENRNDDVIDVEFWECKAGEQTNSTGSRNSDAIICTPIWAYNQR